MSTRKATGKNALGQDNLPMISIVRTSSTDPDFHELVAMLDAELRVRDGDEHEFYAPYNTLDAIKHAVVAYDCGRPVGCGAIKPHEGETVEIKRMFVRLNSRGQGIATLILSELEAWAAELGHTRFILETGKKQPEAIAMYEKSGYTPIPNYGQYQSVENSVCFEKLPGLGI